MQSNNDREAAQIDIPAFLHEFHGRRSARVDIALTYSAGLFAAIAAVVLATRSSGVEFGTLALVALLGADIGGGVVANFTRGTSEYYAESPPRRFVFVGLHVLQPLGFAWIFPRASAWIACVCGGVLLATLAVNAVREYERQRTLAATLAIALLGVIALASIDNAALSFLVTLYALKLVLAFAVR
jgi:hypothetical protein